MANQESEALSRRNFLGAAGIAASLLASGTVMAQRAESQELTLPTLLGEEVFEVRKRPRRRSWVIDVSGRRILCFPDPKNDCVVIGVTGLLQAAVLMPFHDNQLARATRSINNIFRRMDIPSGQQLAMLTTHDGPFLAFVQESAIGSADLAERIQEALGIQQPRIHP